MSQKKLSIRCTAAYPDLTDKMAMTIGGQYKAEKILPKHWAQLCETIEYRYIALKQLIEKQSTLVLEAAEKEIALNCLSLISLLLIK